MERLALHVAGGEFRSIDAAIVQLLDEYIAERNVENDYLARVKPFVDEALAFVARGDVFSAEAHAKRMNRLLLNSDLAEAVRHWSMSTLRDPLVKIGARQMAEVMVPPALFGQILAAIATLRQIQPLARC